MVTMTNDKRKELLDALVALGVAGPDVTRIQIGDAYVSIGKSRFVPPWILNDPSRRIGRGIFSIPELVGYNGAPGTLPTATKPKRKTPKISAAQVIQTAEVQTVDAEQAAVMNLTGGTGSLVPQRLKGYVPFGNAESVETVIRSGLFYPVFVTGLSGNGKTTMIEQACANLDREFYRVNITCQTDEDDLLGGFRLVNGATVWQDGPVVQAMKSGGILLLDEIDLASHAIMCLQPVLEGRGVFLKKISQWVTPAKGFNILATANTKGKGDDTGRFASTNILNEAFLDRFPVTLEQDYPAEATERKILRKYWDSLGVVGGDITGFVRVLVSWADLIRKGFREGTMDEIVTTRRLLNILTAYAMFGDASQAVRMGITRFDSMTQEAFLRVFNALDSTNTNTNTEQE